MACKNRPPAFLALLLLGALDCTQEPSPIEIGRLDLVIRPDSAASSSARLRGGFMLRDLERGTHELIAIDGEPYQTRSAWLDPGSYVLEWQPAPDLADALDLDAPPASGAEVLATERHVVVIADGRVTTVNVRATQRASSLRDAIAGAD